MREPCLDQIFPAYRGGEGAEETKDARREKSLVDIVTLNAAMIEKGFS